MMLDPKTLQPPSNAGCRSKKRPTPFQPKKQTKKRKQKPLKTPSKTIIEFARAGELNNYLRFIWRTNLHQDGT